MMNGTLRASGALALADLNAKDSLPEILNCIENEENEFTRRDMLRAVHKFRDKSSLKLLFNLITNDESWEVRKKCAEIRMVSNTKDFRDISFSVRDNHMLVKQEAEKALKLINLEILE